MMTTKLLAFGMPGPFELAIIAGILVLLFGSKLPKIMYDLGSATVQFKKGLSAAEELGDEVKKQARDVEQEVRNA